MPKSLEKSRLFAVKSIEKPTFIIYNKFGESLTAEPKRS